MKRMILFIMVLALLSFGFSPVGGANQVDFPDIYIDPSDGGGVGSEADPYEAFSDINWTTGGDNSVFDYYDGGPAASVKIHLKRGGTLNEKFNPPGANDGTAAYPIYLTAYDTGADPIIDMNDGTDFCVEIEDNDYYVIENMDLREASTSMINMLESSYITVQNCTIHDGSANGIYAWACSNLNVDSNTIYSCTSAIGKGIFWISCSVTVIENNTIYNCGYCLIDIHDNVNGTDGDNHKVRYNLLYYDDNHVDEDNDPNGFYCEANNANTIDDIEVYYNVFVNMDDTSGERHTLCNLNYETGDVTPIIVRNNSFYNMGAHASKSCVFTDAACDGATFTNNSFYSINPGNASFYITDSTGISADYNSHYVDAGDFAIVDAGGYNMTETAGYIGTTGFDTNGVFGDPNYRSKTTGNLRVYAHSPLVDAGVDVSLTIDYDGITVPHGVAPDIGAFENINNPLIWGTVYVKGIVNIKDR